MQKWKTPLLLKNHLYKQLYTFSPPIIWFDCHRCEQNAFAAVDRLIDWFSQNKPRNEIKL
jgi:hypothetical protein